MKLSFLNWIEKFDEFLNETSGFLTKLLLMVLKVTTALIHKSQPLPNLKNL